MSKADKIKEQIGWLKVKFGILVITNISLIAWLVQNYAKASVWLLAICCLAVIVISAAILWVDRAAQSFINDLEDL
jgi:hypothetical protein